MGYPGFIRWLIRLIAFMGILLDHIPQVLRQNVHRTIKILLYTGDGSFRLYPHVPTVDQKVIANTEDKKP